MKMSDVRVGMRLRSTLGNSPFTPITVTALTERGFEYRFDEPVALVPRLGIIYPTEGHEHFGLDGEAFYEVLE
jgi:hypothetical protein